MVAVSEPRPPGRALGVLSMQLRDTAAAESYFTRFVDVTDKSPDEERDPAKAVAALAALAAPLKVLDDALARTRWLVGGRFTVADINVSEIVRYAGPAPELFEAHPNVKAWHEACKARPAFKKMWAEREAEPV